MADFVFNIAKGRVNELYRRVDGNDPANSAIIVVAINTSEADATLIDLDNLSLVLANANTAEVTNANYARKVLTDSDLAAQSPDDTNDRQEADLPDQTWSSVGAGDAWTDLLICYDNDTTAGDDTNIIPLVQLDFAATPNGGDITAQFNAAGFYRAS